MDRRDLLLSLPAIGLAAALPLAAASADDTTAQDSAAPGAAPLHRPLTGDIPVAFLMSDNAVVIDFAGPWEVFQDVVVPGRANANPFRLYTVGETASAIRASGGMTIMPNYTIANAPLPKVLVIPAQQDPSPAILAWVRQVAPTADLTMSISKGAFLLARTGLLAGKPATTQQDAFAQLAQDFPELIVRRGERFVDNGSIATSAGASSGIDLALHVVERYFGQTVASATADRMEYQGTGWLSSTTPPYAFARISTPQGPLCAVCKRSVNARTAPRTVYNLKTYLFCGPTHKDVFLQDPSSFVPA